jgi:hypothetical protein
MAATRIWVISDDVWSAFEDVNPVGLVVDELVTGGLRKAGWPQVAKGWTAVPDERAGGRTLISTAALCAARTAALAALAGQRFLPSAAVTAAVAGPEADLPLQAAVLARCMPALSHVAISQHASRVPPRLRDQLDLAGIGLYATEAVEQAVRGANLVLASGSAADRLTPGLLSPGALVVIARERPPRDLVWAAAQAYADYPELLPVGQEPAGSYFGRRLDGGLREVVTGTYAGRPDLDGIVLVIVLSGQFVNADLAFEVHRIAQARGLGTGWEP